MSTPVVPLAIDRRSLITGGCAGASLLLLPRPARAAAHPRPIGLHPSNPRYFLWRGKPRMLLGASEHFGAVLNRECELTTYLDTIARSGSNITRTFSGTFVEPHDGGDFLQVAGDKLILPWVRSKQPGYKKGGNKFDLTKFDPAYFARLRTFVAEAGKRGVVVMYVLFAQHYDDHKWTASPFNPTNNVNGFTVDRLGAHTLDRHGGLLPIQEALMKRVVAELRPFDNVIYEMTHSRAHNIATPEWERHVIDFLAKTLKRAGDRKLIAQNFGHRRPPGEVTDPRVGVLSHTLADEALLDLYPEEKRPVGMAETGFALSTDREARARAWDFVLGGAGLFIHVDHSFAPHDQRGERLITKPNPQFGGGPVQRQHLHALIRIVDGLDFIKMKPAPELVRGLPPALRARALEETGRSYLIYVRQAPTPKEISVRWTGKLVPKRSGEHTLFTTADDGTRVWLDGKPVVDNWTENRGTARDAAKVTLDARRTHDLKIEYFYSGGPATMRLEWEGPQLPRELVPPSQLRTPTGAPGLRAQYFAGRDLAREHLVRTDASVDYTLKAATIFAPPKWTPGPVAFEADLPAGEYRVDWLDPASGGRYGSPETVKHAGGTLKLAHPHLVEDVAARLTRIS